jgi:demethylmenaquinone methyltransferase/2-methoxy-6-polyprenyl-1,4-benzoquinol methylase
LTPGGRLVVVDFFSKEEIPPVRFYLDHVLPLIGRLVSHSRSAYTYLRESKKGFWTPEELTQHLLAAGFREVMTKPDDGHRPLRRRRQTIRHLLTAHGSHLM